MDEDNQQLRECRVRGEVVFEIGNRYQPDAGAVVMLLPKSVAVDQRQRAEPIHPLQFQPLDNPAIDMVHRLGGAIVRADTNGRFDVYVKVPGSYSLLVVSKNRANAKTLELSRSQMATLSTFFIPVEDLLGDRAYYWDDLKLNQSEYKAPTVTFSATTPD
jgi:hypothetical protein